MDGNQQYDPWGKVRNAAGADNGAGPIYGSRGFTDHEHLQDLGLIHMNGRVYDPSLGRFLSADPFVQAANYSQSYNRYGYVWNNPAAAVDPMGYETMFIDLVDAWYGEKYFGQFEYGLLNVYSDLLGDLETINLGTRSISLYNPDAVLDRHNPQLMGSDKILVEAVFAGFRPWAEVSSGPLFHALAVGEIAGGNPLPSFDPLAMLAVEMPGGSSGFSTTHGNVSSARGIFPLGMQAYGAVNDALTVYHVTSIMEKYIDMGNISDRAFFLQSGPTVSAPPWFISSPSTSYEIDFIRNNFGIVIDT